MGWVLILLWVRNIIRFYSRVAKVELRLRELRAWRHWSFLFVALLYRSWFQHRILKQVSWKGRTYAG